VARVLYEEMARRLDDGRIKVSRIVIGETCAAKVTYRC